MTNKIWKDPLTSMNPGQRELVDNIDGIYVVDAGPGTGKTFTIARRYMSLIDRDGVSPDDVLMLTFTENAAEEMDKRIKGMLNNRAYKDGTDIDNPSKRVQTRTFDSMCLSIVMDSIEHIGYYFGITDVRLSRNASISTNDAQNRRYFSRFLDSFIQKYCLNDNKYRDIASIVRGHPDDLMKVLDKLMSRGITPSRYEDWTGYDKKHVLWGTLDIGTLKAMNKVKDNKKRSNQRSDLCKILDDIDPNMLYKPPKCINGCVDETELDKVITDPNQKDFIAFVYNVYLEYIRQCIRDDRLTFPLTALLAFTVLYHNKEVRERNRYRYITVDEFQDTNPLQMMTTLMLLKEPNLCVVGDWKQGIYGFRFADISNIKDFENRLEEFSTFLNTDEDRVVSLTTPVKLCLSQNYRSSPMIIEASFKALTAPGNDDESRNKVVVTGVEELVASHGFITDDDSHVRYVLSKDKESEPLDVINAIKDYVTDENYIIIDKDGNRHKAGYGDIAVLCRTTEQCIFILRALMDVDIPAFLQGDVRIMDTREGKLALAWLRFVNNREDPWGYLPILADMDPASRGYLPSELVAIRKMGAKGIPRFLDDIRDRLYSMRQRVGHLLCAIFDLYGLDNDITQSIISNMTELHDKSMMTVPDIISIMEHDITNNSDYPIENPIDDNAVRIMTMHRSKGLEFPIVITPFIDSGSMPQPERGGDTFILDDTCGLRSMLEMGRFEQSDGSTYKKVCDNWKSRMAKECSHRNYDEERRLLFVTLSRAWQYITVIASSKKKSKMFSHLAGKRMDVIPLHDSQTTSCIQRDVEKPTFTGISRKVSIVGVHDIMRFAPDTFTSIKGKGVEFGQRVHDIAQDLFYHRRVDDDLPEVIVIGDFLESLSDCRSAYCEKDCYLPIPDTDITLHGIMDLIVEYDDHVEIHDYKTDLTHANEEEYRLQLSVYAQSASKCLGNKPARCFIRYVSIGCDEISEFEPMTMEEISKIVIARIG